jgi:uncharacterized membrane protein
MTVLIIGLILFLGIHSVRVFAEDWRSSRLQAMGEGAWKGLYSVVSIVGFGLVVWGYGLARQAPVVIWSPPVFTRHLASLLTLVSFVLLAAAYVPRNRIKTALRHPMTLGVKVWALAHLLANGTLADVLLFGGFLVWAVLVFRAARKRDRAAAPMVLPSSGAATIATVFIGLGAWAAFAFWAHAWLIGVRPFG